MKNDSSRGLEMPLGLGMALAKNGDALQAFSALSKERQQQIIDHTHSITSKQQMQAYVEDITKNAGGNFQ